MSAEKPFKIVKRHADDLKPVSMQAACVLSIPGYWRFDDSELRDEALAITKKVGNRRLLYWMEN